ncbi:MAG: hypothetical protein K2K35_10485, partial [Lachnospiraceae bacterium]|nr:hypothetical protein [Lachnospiraceae bacterium]
KGVVTAKKQGRATIWAKLVYRSGGKKRTRNFSCKVTIKGKSEPASNTVEKPGGPQNELETNQPEQTVSKLKIIAEGVPVEVRLASDGQYSYKYNKDEYAVMTTTNGLVFEIKVTSIRPWTGGGNQTNVIICIPDQSYTLITCILAGSTLILPEINVNITISSKASTVVSSLPSDYNKTLNYTGNASSCLLSMNEIKDFAIKAKIFTSSVLLQSSWPEYDMRSPSYNYTSGNGTAKINIDIKGSSFIFE